MTGTSVRASRGSVLVSGASIAGPTLAYWLHRYGFEVTVVERSHAVRGGGYPIDVRGAAVEVIRRMGLREQLRAAHIDTRALTFLDRVGDVVARMPTTATSGGGVPGRDVELPRGDLTEMLYRSVRDDVEFVFDDSIEQLDEHDDGIDVRFRSGARRRYDLVVGTDGLHSHTRGLVFGAEEQFERYLGTSFAGFTMPNETGLSHEGVVWSEPGRAAVLYAAGDPDRVHAFFTFAGPRPGPEVMADPAAQREMVTALFDGEGWRVPAMLDALRAADDLFFDTVSQIHMPTWSRGRVALVGDAAYAPSFMSGQGSSIALVGAYVLAGELAVQADHRLAFAAYEQRARSFVQLNQALAGDGSSSAAPRTRAEIDARDEALRRGESFDITAQGPDVTIAIVLPDYERMIPAGALT